MKDDDLVPYYYGCIVLILALSGCAGLQPVIATDYAIASGEAQQTIESAKLTENEKLVITHAINTYSSFIEKWKHDENIILKTDEFLNDYAVVKRQYLALHKIIEAKWKQYEPEEQEKLKSYDHAAGVFGESVRKMAYANSWREAGKDAISLGFVLIGMAKTL